MTDLSKGGDTLGLPARIPVDGVYLHNQRIGLVEITDAERVSAAFLNYYLRTSGYRSYVLGTASGSTVRHTSPSRIQSYVAELPTLDEQHGITAVLSALDDKIGANAKLLTDIGPLARSIFRQSLISSSALPLSMTAEFINGKAFTKGASGTGRVVVRIAELNSGLGGSTVYSDVEVDEKHVARAGDILFAWSGSLTLHRWYRDEAIINQHIFKVIPKDDYPSWLVYELVTAKLAEFKSIAADKATTMGHIQRHHLDGVVQVPTAAEIARIGEVMSTLWQRTLLAEQESLALADLRDTLLPELMSGRLRVKEAEKKLEEVV